MSNHKTGLTKRSGPIQIYPCVVREKRITAMTAVPSSASHPIPVTADARPKGISRLLFVDNIRVALTILVILHHLMIIYAGTGSWSYTEGRQDSLTLLVGRWFCALNQAYFMGLFLLISAYFVPGSYDRKGGLHFLKDRLIRLGIPLAVFSWVISPLSIYTTRVWTDNLQLPYWSYFPSEYFKTEPLIGAGPLWFVEVLLIFSLLYVVWRLVLPARQVNNPSGEISFPSNQAIAIFALLLGLAGFAVRIVFIADEYNFKPLNLQLPFFAQYIALFVLGLIAMSMCIAVIYVFRRFLNQRGRLSEFLVPNAYTAYIIHAPIITMLALSVRDVAAYPLLKWVVVALVAVPLCFGLSSLIRKLPYTDRVL
jgi:hypothetical protein